MSYRALLVLLVATAANSQAGETANSACAVQVTLAGDADDFYPPGSIRRKEGGEVIIAFDAAPGDDQARGIEVVRTSGFPELDNAALKLARALKVSSPCAPSRVRWSVHFDYGPVQRLGNSDVSFGVGKVLLVPDESSDN